MHRALNSDTQDVDLEEQEDIEGGGDNTAGDDAGDDGYFLTIDERNRYKTAEDAQKAFASAGQRISQLTPYEKVLKGYGINDPAALAPLLDELIQHRTRGKNQEGRQQEDSTRQNDPLAGLSAEEKKGVAYLQKVLPMLGLDPKQVKSVIEQSKTLGEFQKTSEEKEAEVLLNTRRNEGLAILKSLTTEAGMKFTNPAHEKRVSYAIEAFMRDFINESKDRIDAFYEGGAALDAVIREAFEDYKTNVYFPMRGSGQADVVRNKTAQTQSLKKPVGVRTPTRAGKNENSNQNVNRAQKAMNDRAALHKKAYEVASKAWGGGTTEE